jgi:hypothetical protein
MWLYAFALVWTAVASSATTVIVLKRRGYGLKIGELVSPYPVPAWVPTADELKHRLPAPMPAAASAVTIRFVVPSQPREDAVESWDRDETTPRRPSCVASRPTVVS